MTSIFSTSSTLASFTQTYQKITDSPSVEGLRTEASKRLSGLKSWKDFFSVSSFKKPTDYASFRNRFDFNVLYFQNNYLLVTFLVVAWLLLSNIILLIGVGLAIAASKFIQSLPSNQPTVLFGTPFLPAQLWIVYGITFTLWFWLSGATSALFYCVGICAFLVAAHAGSLDKPVEAEFATESEFTEMV
jgi:hypothetical protein